MTSAASQQYAKKAAYRLRDVPESRRWRTDNANHDENTRATSDQYLVLLLHGLGGDYNQPLGLTPERFSSLSVSTLAPDARAHGQTRLIGEPERFTSAHLAEDVLALVDSLGLEDRVLVPVGISMGAAVGLELVSRHTGRVGGAVLIRPSFGPDPWPPHLQVFKLIAGLLHAHGPAGLDAFIQSPEYGEHLARSASAAASLRDQFTKPLSAERAVRLETVPGNVAVTWSQPRDFGVPITIVGAHGDPGHPLDVARLWHEMLTGSMLFEAPSRDDEPQTYAAEMARAATAGVQAALAAH